MTTDVKKFVSTKMYQIGRDAIDYGIELTIDDAEYMEKRKELVERSFMQSSKELNDAILKDFQKNERKTWDEVISRVSKLDDDVKPIFAPNIGATKEVVETVLKGSDLDNEHVLRRITTGSKKFSFTETNIDFLKGVYADVEKFEAISKSTADDIVDAFGAVTSAVSAVALKLKRPGIAAGAVAAGGAVKFVHYGSKVIAGDIVRPVIDNNNNYMAKQKIIQKKLKITRPVKHKRVSPASRKYMNTGTGVRR